MNVLVIAPRFPWPLEKGDKLRLFQQMKVLSRRHNLHLFAITHVRIGTEDLEQLAPLCASIHVHRIPRWRVAWNMWKGLFNRLPFSVLYFTDRAAISRLLLLYHHIQPDLVYGQLIRTGEYLRDLPGDKVIDMMDAFSMIMAQRAEQSPWWSKAFLRLEARRLQSYERAMPARTSRQTFISHRDRHVADPEGHWPASVVPNGIDTDFFRPGQVLPVCPFHDLTFVGNLGYYPNRMAVLYLVHSIMPLVWSKRPETTLLLAGARPPSEIMNLADHRITVIPWLDDIRTGYQQGSVFVAPIHLGAGQQNKILEAMAMELPVITTNHVNQGIHATAGRELLLADQPEEFAEHILELLEHPERMANLTSSARTFVVANYSWVKSVEALEHNVFLDDKHDHTPAGPSTSPEHH